MSSREELRDKTTREIIWKSTTYQVGSLNVRGQLTNGCFRTTKNHVRIRTWRGLRQGWFQSNKSLSKSCMTRIPNGDKDFVLRVVTKSRPSYLARTKRTTPWGLNTRPMNRPHHRRPEESNGEDSTFETGCALYPVPTNTGPQNPENKDPISKVES